MREFLIAGNWKMNAPEIAVFASGLTPAHTRVKRVICPPYPFLYDAVAKFDGKDVAVGAQDVSERGNGAFTGDVSAPMIAATGARYVIVGHSERRQYHHESDELVAAKAKAVIAQGLTAIVCVGETLDERDVTTDVITRQVNAVISAAGTQIIIAYEPVWAIGTGKTASPDDADEVCALIKTLTGGATVLYGGSMTPDNAESLLRRENIDGGLIGGASLDAAKFNAICAAAVRCAEI